MSLNRLGLWCLAVSMLVSLAGCYGGPGDEVVALGRDPGATSYVEKTVHARVEVEHVEASLRELRAEVARRHGWIVSANVYRNDDERDATASLQARIPASELDAFRRAVADLGDLRTEEEHAEDVTDEVVGRDARLESARAAEARLLAMRDDTSGFQDALALEAQVAETRAVIEQLEAEDEAQRERVAEVLVSVEITPVTVLFWEEPIASIASAAKAGQHFAAFVVVGSVSAAVALAPSVLIITVFVVPLALAIRKIAGRWRNLSAS